MTNEQANIFSYILTGMSLSDFAVKMTNDIRVDSQEDNNEVDNNLKGEI